MVHNTVETPIKPQAYYTFRMCTRKKKYNTRGLAEQDVDKMQKLGRDSKPNIKVYKCPECLAFHIGHGKWSADEQK
jgi:hypothetical protein